MLLLELWDPWQPTFGGLGFRALGFRVKGLGCRDWGLLLEVYKGLGGRVPLK